MTRQASDSLDLNPQIYLRDDLRVPIEIPSPVGDLVVFTSSRPRGSGINEDASAVIPLGLERLVLVLADGMGGSAAGDRAAEIAVRAVVERVQGATQGGSAVRNAVLDAAEEANQEIRDLHLGAGTTLLVTEIFQGEVQPCHAGDSLAVVFDRAGNARLRTPAHSPVGYAVESGMLDESHAMTHQGRHLLANALGKLAMHVEVGARATMSPGETLVLASDGLYDNLTIEEIGQLVTPGELCDSVHQVVTLAMRRMASPRNSVLSKPDDLTILAYRYQPAEVPETLEFAPVDAV